jgi:hypothetical protein
VDRIKTAWLRRRRGRLVAARSIAGGDPQPVVAAAMVACRRGGFGKLRAAGAWIGSIEGRADGRQVA